VRKVRGTGFGHLVGCSSVQPLGGAVVSGKADAAGTCSGWSCMTRKPRWPAAPSGRSQRRGHTRPDLLELPRFSCPQKRLGWATVGCSS